jgi:hypothetical protein
MLSLLFSSCDKCKLANAHTVNISWTQPVVYNTGGWSSSSNTTILNGIVSSLRDNCDQPRQLAVVPSGAEYYVTVDTVFCTSSESSQTVGDPCWKSEGWLHDRFHPQPQSTYTLYSSSVTIYFTIKDTLNHFEESFAATGSGSDYLYQPPGDSTNCYGYEIRGDGGPWTTVAFATSDAYCDIKCIINKWLHGRL